MATQPRTDAQRHYRDAERLLAAAESSVTEGIQNTATLCALAHAVLTLSPRRARRQQRPGRHLSSGASPTAQWPYGHDQDGGQR